MENIENGAIPSFFSQTLFAVIYLGCWGFLPAENFSSGTARFRKSPQFSVDFRFYCRGLRKLFFSNSAYRTKSVSGPIIHSFRNGYLVLWWSSSHTRPSPHFSGREASSALMPYRSLSRSTSASVGISRSVSAIVFGHSTCR